MEPNNEELSRRLVEIEYIRKELENYISTLGSLQGAQEAVQKALAGLIELKAENKSVLVPFAQDIYFDGTISGTDSPLISIGSNIYMRTTVPELKKRLESNMNQIGSQIEEIAKAIEQLQQQGNTLEKEISQLYDEFQKSLQ